VIVIDASLALTWCFEDQASSTTEAVLDKLASGEQAAAPAIWPYEVANGLLIAERRGRITEAQAAALLQLLTGLPISIEHRALSELMAVSAVGRFHRLAVYEASYLDLAARLGAKLATADGRLAAAAAKAGVSLVR
jgi:predicted nucleic acid-binding protein